MDRITSIRLDDAFEKKKDENLRKRYLLYLFPDVLEARTQPGKKGRFICPKQGITIKDEPKVIDEHLECSNEEKPPHELIIDRKFPMSHQLFRGEEELLPEFAGCAVNQKHVFDSDFIMMSLIADHLKYLNRQPDSPFRDCSDVEYSKIGKASLLEDLLGVHLFEYEMIATVWRPRKEYIDTLFFGIVGEVDPDAWLQV
ncbi:MAG: hypothetical protein LUE24_11475 [Lachnospiraceae bacterium]|nr:hypothetical protein [Lachnospiraceae bacterium]